MGQVNSSTSSTSSNQQRTTYALHEAVKEQDVARVGTLILQGKKAWKIDSQGFTPLHYAAMAGNREIIDSLLQAGAHPITKDSKGRTAIQIATSKGWDAASQAMQDWIAPSSSSSRSYSLPDGLLDFAEVCHILSHADFSPIRKLSKPLELYGQKLTHHYNYTFVGSEKGLQEMTRHLGHIERESPAFAALTQERMAAGQVVGAIVEGSAELAELKNAGQFHPTSLKIDSGKSAKTWFVVDVRAIEKQGGAHLAGVISHEEFHYYQEALRRARRGMELGQGLPYTLKELSDLGKAWEEMVNANGWLQCPPKAGTAAYTIFEGPYQYLRQTVMVKDQVEKLKKFNNSPAFRMCSTQEQKIYKELLRECVASKDGALAKLNIRFYDEIGTSLMEAKVEFGLGEVLRLKGEPLAARFDQIFGKKLFLESSAKRTRALFKSDLKRAGRATLSHGFEALMAVELMCNVSSAMAECRLVEGEKSAWAAHGMIRGAARLLSDFILDHIDRGVASAADHSYFIHCAPNQQGGLGPISFQSLGPDLPGWIQSVSKPSRGGVDKIRSAKMAQALRFGRPYIPLKGEPSDAELKEYNEYCAKRWREGEGSVANAWCRLYDRPPAWVYATPLCGSIVGLRLFDSVVRTLSNHYPSDPESIAYVADHLTAIVRKGELFPPGYNNWSAERKADYVQKNLIDRAQKVMDQSITEAQKLKKRQEIHQQNRDALLQGALWQRNASGIDSALTTAADLWDQNATASDRQRLTEPAQEESRASGDDKKGQQEEGGELHLTIPVLPPRIDPDLYKRQLPFYVTDLPDGVRIGQIEARRTPQGVRIGPTDGSFIVKIAASTSKGFMVVLEGTALEWGANGLEAGQLWGWIAKAGHLIGQTLPVTGPLIFVTLVGLQLNDYYKRKRASKRADDIEENHYKSVRDVANKYNNVWKPLTDNRVGNLSSDDLEILRRASLFISKKMGELVESGKKVAKDEKLKEIDKAWVVSSLSDLYTSTAQKKALIDLRIAYEEYYKRYENASLEELKKALPSALPAQKEILVELALGRILPSEEKSAKAVDLLGPVGEIYSLAGDLSYLRDLHTTLLRESRMDDAEGQTKEAIDRLDLPQVRKELVAYFDARAPNKGKLLSDVKREECAPLVKPQTQYPIDKHTRHDLEKPDSLYAIVDRVNSMSFEALTSSLLDGWIKFCYEKAKNVAKRENKGVLGFSTSGEEIGNGIQAMISGLEARYKDRLYWDSLQGKDFNGLIALAPEAKSAVQRAHVQRALKEWIEAEVRSGSPDVEDHLNRFAKEFDDPRALELSGEVSEHQKAISLLRDLPAEPNADQIGTALLDLAQVAPGGALEGFAAGLFESVNSRVISRYVELNNKVADYAEGKDGLEFDAIRKELARFHSLSPKGGARLSETWIDYFLLKGQTRDAGEMVGDLEGVASPFATQLIASRTPFLDHQKGVLKFEAFHEQAIALIRSSDQKERLAQLYATEFLRVGKSKESADEIASFLERVYAAVSTDVPQLAPRIDALMQRAAVAIDRTIRSVLEGKRGVDIEGARKNLARLYNVDDETFGPLYQTWIAQMVEGGRGKLADSFHTDWKDRGRQSLSDKEWSAFIEPFIDGALGKISMREFLSYFDGQMATASRGRQKKIRALGQGVILPYMKSHFRVTQEVFNSLFRSVGKDFANQPTFIPGLRHRRKEEFDRGKALKWRRLAQFLSNLHELDPALFAALVQFGRNRHPEQRAALSKIIGGSASTLAALKELFWDDADWNGRRHTAAFLSLLEYTVQGSEVAPIGQAVSKAKTLITLPNRIGRVLDSFEGKLDLVTLALPGLFDSVDLLYRKKTGYLPESGGWHLFKQTASPLVSAIPDCIRQEWLTAGSKGMLALYQGIQSRDYAMRVRLMNIQIAIEQNAFGAAQKRLDAIDRDGLRADDQDLYDELEVALAYSRGVCTASAQSCTVLLKRVVTLSNKWLAQSATSSASMKRPALSVLQRRGSALLALRDELPKFEEQFAALISHYEHRQIFPCDLLAEYHSKGKSSIAKACLRRLSAASVPYLQEVRQNTSPILTLGWLLNTSSAKENWTLVHGSSSRSSSGQLAPSSQTEKVLVETMRRGDALLLKRTLQYLRGECTESQLSQLLSTPKYRNGSKRFVLGWAAFLRELVDSSRGRMRGNSFKGLDFALESGFKPPIDFFLSSLERRGCGASARKREDAIVRLLSDRFDYNKWRLHEKILLLFSLNRRSNRKKWNPIPGEIRVSQLVRLGREVIHSADLDGKLLALVRGGLSSGSLQKVKALLQRGALPDLVYDFHAPQNPQDDLVSGVRPDRYLLHLFAGGQRPDLIRLFAKYGADFDVRDAYGFDPLLHLVARLPEGKPSSRLQDTIDALILDGGVDSSRPADFLDGFKDHQGGSAITQTLIYSGRVAALMTPLWFALPKGAGQQRWAYPGFSASFAADLCKGFRIQQEPPKDHDRIFLSREGSKETLLGIPRKLNSPLEVASMSLVGAKKYITLLQTKGSDYNFAQKFIDRCIVRENWDVLVWMVETCMPDLRGKSEYPLGEMGGYARKTKGKTIPFRVFSCLKKRGLIGDRGWGLLIQEGRVDIAKRYVGGAVRRESEFQPMVAAFIEAAVAGHYGMVVWLKKQMRSKLSIRALDPEGVFGSKRKWLEEVKKNGEMDLYHWFVDAFEHTPGDRSYKDEICVVM